MQVGISPLHSRYLRILTESGISVAATVLSSTTASTQFLGIHNICWLRNFLERKTYHNISVRKNKTQFYVNCAMLVLSLCHLEEINSLSFQVPLSAWWWPPLWGWIQYPQLLSLSHLTSAHTFLPSKAGEDLRSINHLYLFTIFFIIVLSQPGTYMLSLFIST